jgi:cellulose synthase/poly-beta-1,6-N-acetylglucosamine synthase-like glycosyltransferase
LIADNAGLWRHRRAREVRIRNRLLLSALGGLGAVSLIRLADWWFRPEHIGQPVLFVALSLAFWYGMSRIALGWINYAAISRPVDRPAPPDLSVAIFTTSSPGEPLAMFEKTLAACRRIPYPHETYLLDDTGDPRYRELAVRHGATWLELRGIPGAKAGKINRALELTREDYILVLDPDHLPFPEIFERVLGHFADPTVGFVQVAQAYYNQRRSFTARGAAEQTYAFYGPGQMGLYGHGTAVAIGANCTFRRSALTSIGGHGIGLAEDLVTAIRLHAAGWRSVYLPEVVSRGLVPEDLGSFFRQQLKWSRGVYEVVFAELPRLFGKLRWRQRLSYLAIGTYYMFGITVPIFLLFPYLYLWAGVQPANMRFGEFIVYAAPVGVIGAAMYLFVQRWLVDPSTERGTHWRGAMLKLACWPVSLAGSVLAMVRAEIPYIPTAKEAVRGRFFRLCWPQLLLLGLYAVTLGWIVNRRIWHTPEGALALSSEAVWGMVFFATLPVALSSGAIYVAWQARHPAAGAPWDAVDPDSLGGSGS